MTFIFQYLPEQLWDKYDDSVGKVTVAFFQMHQPVKGIRSEQGQIEHNHVYLMSLMGRSMTRMCHFISRHRAIRLRESRIKSNLKMNLHQYNQS